MREKSDLLWSDICKREISRQQSKDRFAVPLVQYKARKAPVGLPFRVAGDRSRQLLNPSQHQRRK